MASRRHRQQICSMFIRFISTGGTIDKIYFDAMSQFEIGDSQVKHILNEGLVNFDFDVVSLMQKDSLDVLMTPSRDSNVNYRLK